MFDKKIAVIGCMVVSIIPALLSVGCAKQEQKRDSHEIVAADNPQVSTTANEPLVDDSSRLDGLYTKAYELYYSGATNDALSILDAAASDPGFISEKSRIFGVIIQIILQTGDVEAARARFAQACTTDATMVGDAAGIIYSHYMQFNQQTNIVTWTADTLSIAQLPASLREALQWWNWEAHMRTGNDAEVLKIAESLLNNATDGTSSQLLQRGIEAMFAQNKIGIVKEFLEKTRDVISSNAETQDFLKYASLRLIAERRDWNLLEESVKDCAEKLDDAILQRLLHRAFFIAEKDVGSKFVASIAPFVITNFVGKPRSSAVAARYWCRDAAKKRPSDLSNIFLVLLDAGVQPDIICSLFSTHFYDVIDDPASVVEMQEVGERIVPLATNDNIISEIRTMLLDSHFLLNDFDGAIKILEGGLPGHDENWHKMALSKVKAHRALAQGKPREAVKFFRSFMGTLDLSDDKESVDPSSGIVHTKKMILGHNAKRIGDILAAIPDPSAAADAYKEAVTHYSAALKEDVGEATEKVIRQALSEIPQ